MGKRYRFLTADIAFAAVLVLCAALAVLAYFYQADAELQQQCRIHLSVARRDAAYITRDTGQLLLDIDRALQTMLEATGNKSPQESTLQHVRANFPYLRSLSLADRDGKVLASTAPDNVGQTVDTSQWLALALTPGNELRLGLTHAGRDLSSGMPLTDNARATPDIGFIPLAHLRQTGDGAVEMLIATIDVGHLKRQTAAMLEETPGTRVALVRTDGLRMLDTAPSDAGLSMIERDIVERWKNGETEGVREQEAIDSRNWIIAHQLHPSLPFGVIWAADSNALLAASAPARRNHLTALLSMLAGMICALFGYVFFRYSTRHERERLAQTEAQRRLLESTLNACTIAIVITRRDGIVEWANPAFTALTGYEAAEAVGKNPGALCKSGIQSGSFYAQMWQTILDGRVWRGELVNRRKDESLYDELLTISPAFDADGQIQHFIATKEDFTEHKAVREELEVAHSHLKAVVENFPGALVMEDTFGRIVLLNQSIFDLLGLPGTNDYVLGRPIYPLMVFTSQVAEDGQAFLDRVEELRAGARPEYGEEIHFKDGRWVERDFIPIRLHDNLIGYLYIYRDISQKKRHARELWQLATSDPLTGIPNRRAFFESIERERARLARYPGEAAILMMDIDHFKQINDTHGHAAGDAMLCHIVRQVKKLLRESDTLARLGGEEFAVLLPQASRDGALGLAERVRKVLEDNPLIYNDTPIRVTTSVGVTSMTADDLNTDQTLSRADHALYEAKRKGRNRVEVN
ncbi:MAG: diguanylate cyclase [Azoarcus sp.]|jgi:diguanylate cyclase (GGDEF)-like protein/PAS domain S-box-containing protein|nr:diguanylate cyclase [Azoarcus sp.]